MSFLIRKPFVWGLPYAASVEPSNTCNLRCKECPVGQVAVVSQQKYMEPQDFESIVRKLSGTVCYLMLYFQGEPMMNKKFTEMVMFAKKHRMFVSTSTNAHFLNETVSRKIIESRLDHIIISVDGMSQKTYEKYREGGKLERVQRNLVRMVELKKRMNSRIPFVTVQFLVTSANEHEMLALENWKEKVGFDEVRFKSMQVTNLTSKNSLLPKNAKYNRYTAFNSNGYQVKKKVKNCSRIFTTMVINYEGILLPCCFDKKGDYPFGNIKDLEIQEVWKTEKFQKFRKEVLSPDSGFEMCNNCFG